MNGRPIRQLWLPFVQAEGDLFRANPSLDHPTNNVQILEQALYNSVLLAAAVILYDRRARFDEYIMSQDDSYMEYMKKVKYRLVPGID